MKTIENKFKVGILGGTGMVGQRFITLLEDHPWFQVSVIAASEKSKGKTYEEAVEGRWKLSADIPDAVKNIVVEEVLDIQSVSDEVDFVFSAVDMPKDEIRAVEDAYAMTETPVVSNNSAHRWTEDVPMVIPEINDDHFEIIHSQRRRLGTNKGFVAVKPNCSIQGYVPALAAWKELGPREVNVCTYQAISGAGKTFEDWPEMDRNIIPYISGEEEKSEQEPLKIFGRIENDRIIKDDSMRISAQCLRVPVLDGHTAAVSVSFSKDTSVEELVSLLKGFKGYPQSEDLPSAPKQFIKYLEEDDRPQVKLDVDYERGYGVTIGRLRPDNLFDYKFVGLAHNTIRGAAGGGILSAETLVSKGYIEKK